MPVTLQLANKVRRFGSQGMTVEQIAGHLGLSEQAIIDVLCMLGLPLPGAMMEERSDPTDEERAALRSKMPKRWQDRIERGKQ